MYYINNSNYIYVGLYCPTINGIRICNYTIEVLFVYAD